MVLLSVVLFLLLLLLLSLSLWACLVDAVVGVVVAAGVDCWC